MSVPVPSINPPPGPIEVEARTLHAAALRQDDPSVTDREILDDWAALPEDGRRWLLDAAQKRMEARLAEPGRPDDLEALTRRLTGMGVAELRQQYAGPSVTEAPEHRAARQRTDAEQAALSQPATRVGRWVVGQGWVPVDGLGPYEGATNASAPGIGGTR